MGKIKQIVETVWNHLEHHTDPHLIALYWPPLDDQWLHSACHLLATQEASSSDSCPFERGLWSLVSTLAPGDITSLQNSVCLSHFSPCTGCGDCSISTLSNWPFQTGKKSSTSIFMNPVWNYIAVLFVLTVSVGLSSPSVLHSPRQHRADWVIATEWANSSPRCRSSRAWRRHNPEWAQLSLFCDTPLTEWRANGEGTLPIALCALKKASFIFYDLGIFIVCLILLL